MIVKAFIFLIQALSTEANELLPIYNKMSTRFYKTTEQIIDWRSTCSHSPISKQQFTQTQ